jgi:imidazolonepropionase-like amidohydrolase
MKLLACALCLFASIASVAIAQSSSKPEDPLTPFLKETAPVLVLEHARLIDGTGAAARDDMRIDIANGKITAVQSAKLRNAYPPSAKVIDMTGKTVLPGLVGMHEHLFYPLPSDRKGLLPLYGEMADSAPRLYLAGGVTTARTTGSLETYTDLEVKAAIDAGKIPGPKLWITGPYLEGIPAFTPQMHQLKDAEDAGRLVDYWAAEGVTSFKAYMNITAPELKAAIDHAHAHGIKVTGHLCSVGFKEAAALGIDDLEHGIVEDTEFVPQKEPGKCPGYAVSEPVLANLDIEGPEVQEMIRELVAHHVAVTSTLAVLETIVPDRPPMDYARREQQSLTTAAWGSYSAAQATNAERVATSSWPVLFKKEMQFERDFVKAGGLLLAGCDPTAHGGVLPGFGDQRQVELLVEAGFTPVEAIRIATLNGAQFLGEDAKLGSVEVGKAADLVVVVGNPAEKISDIEQVDTVFKDGQGYDPQKLIASVSGLMGLR